MNCKILVRNIVTGCSVKGMQKRIYGKEIMRYNRRIDFYVERRFSVWVK
jgi:hypothetical protein